MSISRTTFLIALLLGGSLEAQAPSNAAAALDGYWDRVESFGTNTPFHIPQPGSRIFVDGYYSWIIVNTPYGAPRPPLPDSTGTADQLRAVWGPFTADAGTYEVSGNTITTHPLVAKNPAAMTSGTAVPFTYRLAGDSLWVTNAAGATGKYVRRRGIERGGMRGAWRQLEVRAANGNLNNNQPGFRFFVDGYYHWIRVNGTTPRQPLNPQSTAAEVRAVWGPAGFTAQAGTYGMAGDISVQVPVVAKDPFSPGTFGTFRVRMAADTLWSQGNLAGPAENPATGKYIRVRHRPPTDD